MVSAILNILAELLPWVKELFSTEAKRRRENAEMDKAIVCGDVANISYLLSRRFDSVRSKGGGGAGQQGNNRPF